MEEGAGEKKPHAVCLPFPAQGHITPMLGVANLLHARGFHVTFVNSEYNHARLIRTRGAAALSGSPGFRFTTIPDGMPPPSGDVDGDVTQDIPMLCRSTLETCLGPFRRLLAELNGAASTGDHPPVSCIISDLTMSFSIDAAKELGVPCVHLWTASTISYLGFRYYRLLVDRGIVPLTDAKQVTDGYLDTPVEDVPGLRNMRLKDFPSFIRGYPDEYMVEYAIEVTERAAGASAVIINSFSNLEGEAVEAMEALLNKPKVYTIGPLTLITPRSTSTIGNLSLWKEQEECLQWLHDRQPASVVYVNFGSIAVMTNEQLLELAWGLANSGRQFMWIIRRDLVKGDAAVLPPEFLAETAGRGLMASWCPQQEVLKHPAVGLFLTHSGWNSTMESICGGVPVISWPFFSDQLTNCRYQCNEWGVGMEIESNVQRDSITGLITELMDSESGKKMRKRAEEWREKAILAANPGGSSHRNFDELVRDVLLPKK